MRTVKKGIQRPSVVTATDGPELGINYTYRVESIVRAEGEPARGFCSVKFQNGPVKEFGVNGCQSEDLIAIVIDHLESFQKELYACRENALAITKLEEALHWLEHRTLERGRRGVEGTHLT